MSVLNINDFKEKLLGGGARSNLFRVTLRSPLGGLEEISTFMVKGAELPGSTINEITIPFRGRQLKVAGDKTFDPWTVTVINDANFTIRKNIEIWMSAINNHEDGQGTNDNYFVDLDISQIDRNGNELRKYELIGAWPSVLDPIAVSFDAENQIEEFGVTFQYQYWKTDDLIEGGEGFGGGVNQGFTS